MNDADDGRGDQLAHELSLAVCRVTSGVPARELRVAADALSAGYRTAGGGGGVEEPLPSQSALGALAYAATRMPATGAAVRMALRALRDRWPDFAPGGLLDLGAGPGTALWSAAAEFSSLRLATLVEPDLEMAALGRRLMEGTALASQIDTTWTTVPAGKTTRYDPHDLVVAAYLLGELPDEAIDEVVGRAWQAASQALVIVLPGSPGGFRAMLAARRRVLALGGTIVAPCPHDGPCPLPADDWCHFGTRLGRSSLHRRLKGGTLPYEDEKLSYLAATRQIGRPAAGRVLRRPISGNRQVRLRICAVDGLRDTRIPRSRRDVYRRARAVSWGDRWDDA